MLHQLSIRRACLLTLRVWHVQIRCLASAAVSSNGRNYDDAITKLNTLQTGYRKLEELRKRGWTYNEDPIGEMREWVRRLGFQPQDFNRLNIIHVAGTKGKGTTCAYVDSILNQYRLSHGLPQKVGLYTSPHLIAVRERIRINLEPISEHLFAKYFFEIWDRMEATATGTDVVNFVRPNYFRYLTLMSLYVFFKEGVDAAIYEVGMGGEFDSTNVIDAPVAIGVTTLGIDHIESLGTTIQQIAWHKSGIFKKGCPAFSVHQVADAAEVLNQRAQEKSCKLELIPVNDQTRKFSIVPSEEFQRKNASLAIRLAQEYLRSRKAYQVGANDTLPAEFKEGLETAVWRGRCETISRGKQTWYVDGAHTVDSLTVAGEWFAKTVKDEGGARIMIFNQQSTRDAMQLLNTLHQSLSQTEAFHFDHVIFTTNITYKTKVYKSDFQNNNMDTNLLLTLRDQATYAQTWKSLDPLCETAVVLSIEEAIEHVDKIITGLNKAHVFAAGSLHLVGGVLFLLGEAESIMKPRG